LPDISGDVRIISSGGRVAHDVVRGLTHRGQCPLAVLAVAEFLQPSVIA
jgi:hypothetical protein